MAKMVLAFWLAATYVPLIHTRTHSHTMGSGCRPFWGMLRSVCMKHVIMKLTISKWLKATQPSTTRRPTQSNSKRQGTKEEEEEKAGGREQCRRRARGRQQECRSKAGARQGAKLLALSCSSAFASLLFD